MSTIQGKNALITGGAAGIGRIMGELLLKEGVQNLVIWDINQQFLSTALQELKSQGFNVHGYQIDVANTEAIIETAARVRKEVGFIDILINNAGIIVGKEFWHHNHAEMDRTMQINSTSLMHIAKEFISEMIERKTGHIVNIASAAGMVANPKMSVYCASKWAVIGWSDSLRVELEKSNTNVKVTTVTPYYISTGMFEGVRSPIIPILKPEYAAQKIVGAIKSDKIFLRMPGIVNLLPLAKGLLPTRLFDFIVGQLMGVYKSMDHFKGHSK